MNIISLLFLIVFLAGILNPPFYDTDGPMYVIEIINFFWLLLIDCFFFVVIDVFYN